MQHLLSDKNVFILELRVTMFEALFLASGDAVLNQTKPLISGSSG